MTGVLYITSPSANHKTINSLLLHIRDWEYELGDQFALVTTSDTNYLTDLRPTSPPLHVFRNNTWAGRTLEEVESFHLSLDHSNLYIILDDEGTRTQTCILGHRTTVRDPETRAFVRTQHFNKIRVPWDEVYMTWCNLDVANMDFEEFVQDRDREGGPVSDESGWFVYANRAEGKDLSEANIVRRDTELERLRAEGLV